MALVVARAALLYSIGRYSLVSRFPVGCRRSSIWFLPSISVIAIGATCWVPGGAPRGRERVAFVVWVW